MTRDRIALGALLGQLLAILWLTPGSVLRAPLEPTSLATFCSVTVTLVLVASYVTRSDRFDRLVLAVFLAGMPIIYAWAAILHGGRSDLGVEAIGVLAFVGIALAGYARWPWLIGVGILAHGLLWDSWHHGRSGYIPDWYSLGCLVTDLGVGAFALLRWDASTALRPGVRRAAAARPAAD